MHCDGAIRNIEKEILRECAYKGIQVHENFLNYYLKLLSLDPTWGITGKDVLDRSDVQNFIKYVVNQLKNQNTPSMITLKMQFYFTCNYQMKQKMVKRNRAELLLRLRGLEQEIIDVKHLNEEDEINLMYKKIVYYITLASGLGNPTIDAVFKEVRVALGSILDRNELHDFVAQTRFAKIDNLAEFTKLVTGIRLFNKDCGKGGEGMEDLPKLINEALVATSAELQNTLISIMDKVNLMTTALDFVCATEFDERHNYVIAYRLPKGITMADVNYVKDSLIAYRQHELYVRKMMDEIDRIENTSSQIFTILQRALIDLHRVVKHRIAIPVNQVFPHFIKLSDIWCNLQDQTILLAKHNQIMMNLQKYIKVLSFPDSIAEMMIPPGECPMTDTERLKKKRDQKIPQEDNHAMILDPLLYTDLTKLKYEYLGFCAWKIFMTEGALLPGNPGLGIAKTMNMQFVFSSVEAGIAFGRCPEKCVMETIKLARRKPELINLLTIKDRLILVQNIRELVQEPPLLPLTEEVEVQTETHPIKSNIDRNYFWNVWDLRRKAIEYANLTHSKTVSSQTKKSYHRFNSNIQTCDPRDKGAQTKRDNYTNVPKPSTFMFGLRGRKDDKQFIIDLTRPVEE
ncbi:cilia- and flagella-associated protein 206 [Tribolium madens]|uniref:cilia- and flagella-associated protein 206 n=1 Tax=Tribolium madens TaxID=41895 RepID=UPI001CF74580|nr:cilia- and flagella-associated protein 206 [Tribolium madens]